jgi:hypothetical protein
MLNMESCASVRRALGHHSHRLGEKRVAELALKWKLQVVEMDVLRKVLPHVKRTLTLIGTDINVLIIEVLARTAKEAKGDR